MKVKKEMKLMDYLLLSYNRKNSKNLLKYKQVYVNNQQISQFDYLLHENDQVEIKKENTSSLEILYEDQEFVVINKPSGLLSIIYTFFSSIFIILSLNSTEKTRWSFSSSIMRSIYSNNISFIIASLCITLYNTSVPQPYISKKM